MPYISSFERLARMDGRREGLQEGLLEGRQEAELLAWSEAFVDAATLDQVFQQR